MKDQGDEALVARACAAVEREASQLDATTQGKLRAARRAALDALAPPRAGPQPAWLPVGAAATIALVAVGVGLSTRAPVPAAAIEPASEFEVLLGEDDPALYDEELEFYAWLDEQPVAPPPASDDAG
jgi:hypothetical protein